VSETDDNDAAATQPQPDRRRRTWLWCALALAVCAVVTFALAALLMSMFDRKQEGKNPYVRVVDVDDNTTDPAVWGSNWRRRPSVSLKATPSVAIPSAARGGAANFASEVGAACGTRRQRHLPMIPCRQGLSCAVEAPERIRGRFSIGRTRRPLWQAW